MLEFKQIQNDLNEVLSKTFEEVNASSLVLKLIKIYSILYLNGNQSSYCSKCLKKYYTELQINGQNKMKDLQEIQNRTLIPNWNGLKYIHSLGKHINSETITDKEAIEYLTKGNLTESMFKKLPTQSTEEIKKVTIFEVSDENDATPEMIAQSTKKGRSKTKK